VNNQTKISIMSNFTIPSLGFSLFSNSQFLDLQFCAFMYLLMKTLIIDKCITKIRNCLGFKHFNMSLQQQSSVKQSHLYKYVSHSK